MARVVLGAMLAALVFWCGCGDDRPGCAEPLFNCPSQGVFFEQPIRIYANSGQSLGGADAKVTVDGYFTLGLTAYDDTSITIVFPHDLATGRHSLRIDNGTCYTQCDVMLN